MLDEEKTGDKKEKEKKSVLIYRHVWELLTEESVKNVIVVLKDVKFKLHHH